MKAQRLPHLLARLSDTRKHDTLPGDPNLLQVLQLAARNHIKPATQASEILQNRQIAIGFHRKAKRMRQRAQSTIKFTVSIANRCLTINVCRRSRLLSNLAKRNIFAMYAYPPVGAQHCCAPVELIARKPTNRLFFFPRKMWRETCRINEGNSLAPLRQHAAHRTFNTTNVRSSASGALSAKKSTSRNTMSANSAAVTSCLSSINLRKRAVPKNNPSLLVVSAIPSE